MILPLKGFFMSEGPPTGDRAVSTFLDYVALACIFGFVDALIAGKWLIALVALGAAVIFHIIGIKWAQIKLKVGTRFAAGVDRIAKDFRYRRIVYAAIAIILLVSIGVRIFRHYQNVMNEHQVPQQTPPTYTANMPPGGWMASWGATEPQSDGSLVIRSTVRTETLFPLRDHVRVMLVYRRRDNSVDVMNDRDIAKSAIFTVNSSDLLVIDTPIDRSISERGTPNKEGQFSIDMDVVLTMLPPLVGSEKINKLTDVAKFGGDILSKGGFSLIGTKKHSPRQSPENSSHRNHKKKPETKTGSLTTKTEAPAQAPNVNCDYTAVMSNNIFRNGAMPPPNVGSHTLMDNNFVQSGDWNPTADITVEGKDSTVRHNTLEGFNRETIHSTKDADRAVIEDNLLRHDNGGSTQDSAGKGADMEKIRKAMTSNIYVPPCPNMGQPFPD
jgi:hypothetical protein